MNTSGFLKFSEDTEWNIGLKWVNGINVINGNLKVGFIVNISLRNNSTKINLFKCTTRSTRTKYEICIKLTIKTPK